MHNSTCATLQTSTHPLAFFARAIVRVILLAQKERCDLAGGPGCKILDTYGEAEATPSYAVARHGKLVAVDGMPMRRSAIVHHAALSCVKRLQEVCTNWWLSQSRLPGTQWELSTGNAQGSPDRPSRSRFSAAWVCGLLA